jgi:ubiquinone/menaquinone biosynthesis C-methylase UbiE
MEAALQRRIQRYGWDKAATYYETFWQEQLKPAQDLLLQMADLQLGESVLDIACGTGLVSFDALDKLGENGRLLGTDISDKMVEMATALAAEKGENRIQFARMDAEELNLEDHTFDAALCALGLMYVPDPGKALQEMHRVLKPGGRTTAAVWGRRINCGWADIFEIVDRHVASEVCPMFFNLGNANMLELHFKEAGFKKITVQRISTLLIYRNAGEALGAAFDGGPVALAYHKFSEEVKREVHADYLASIAQYKNGEGYEVPGEFVVASGIR